METIIRKLSWLELAPENPEYVETEYGEFNFVGNEIKISTNVESTMDFSNLIDTMDFSNDAELDAMHSRLFDLYDRRMMARAKNIFSRVSPRARVVWGDEDDLIIKGLSKETFFAHFPTEDSIEQLIDEITGGSNPPRV